MGGSEGRGSGGGGSGGGGSGGGGSGGGGSGGNEGEIGCMREQNLTTNKATLH